MNTGTKVTVEIGGHLFNGIIRRKQGKFGYMIEYVTTTSEQNWRTGKLADVTICRTNYFKTDQIIKRS